MASEGRHPIAFRYAVLVCCATLGMLLLSTAIEMHFGFQQARQQVIELQAAQTSAAGREVSNYMVAITRGIHDVAKLPWGSPGYGSQERREEFHRLMSLTPSIIELQSVSSNGRETLMVSRRHEDRVGSLLPVADPDTSGLLPGAARYGRPFARDGHLPAVRIAVGDQDGAVVATVDLRLLNELVAQMQSAHGGSAYVLDADGGVLAHPEPTQALRRIDLSQHAVMRAAGTSRKFGGLEMQSPFGGQEVLASGERIEPLGWLVLVEEPRSEVMKPALATLWRGLVLVSVGAVVSVLAAILFARRMAAPIVALTRAAKRISEGDLSSKISIGRRDEIEDLGNTFNSMAERLSESYAALEAKVAQRTQELSTARDRLQDQAQEMSRLNDVLVLQMEALQERKDEAERASAAKTRFLAAASHDLRQPMHTIGLLVSVLDTRLTNEAQRDISVKLSSGVDTMERLFTSLLDISKLDANAVQARHEPVPVQVILDRLRDRFEVLAVQRGLKLGVRSCRAVVWTDPDLLERCLGNLVANAIAYTQHGRVLVGCRRRQDRLAIQVIDTGPGIPGAQLQTIFEEFVRLPGADVQRGGGLGLGLAIVRRTAGLLDHGVGVRSIPGRGSTFELSLRILPSTYTAEPTDLPVEADTEAALAGAFVLIVDDDPGNLGSLAALCARWGCQVATASDASGAMDELARHLRSPDVILTDLRLGGPTDGLDLIERIRTEVEEPIPGVLISADLAPEIMERACELSVQVLHKPVSAQRILAAAASALLASDGSTAPGVVTA